ncbi:tRNA (adenosine(37)-N6)-threonylcarbamoyltransferase complex dimerization subunit type 1 TsaB [Reinekea forsetii]|nr:tRNA (adenosine(37)-N6)-threonylcarbamoyltransferase complex dimerization subunit type 1 TsaB [Reinekea forsetii]
MKNILSLDTSGEYCSISIVTPEQHFSFHQHRPREHANILLSEINALIQESSLNMSDLDAIVYGRGPGSFTGIRIAAGVAQGLAMALNCPIIPISTLHSLAYSAFKAGHRDCWVALDARMSEIYFAPYSVDDSNTPNPLKDEAVLPPSLLKEAAPKNVTFIGNGWTAGYEMSSALSAQVAAQTIHILVPNALDSAELAMKLHQQDPSVALSPELALPTYLRDNVTWDNKPKVGS